MSFVAHMYLGDFHVYVGLEINIMLYNTWAKPAVGR